MFFFFQAEDGIRDVAVTGVQTCALPISDRGHRLHRRDEGDLQAPGGRHLSCDLRHEECRRAHPAARHRRARRSALRGAKPSVTAEGADSPGLREQIARNQQTIDRLNRDLERKSDQVRIIQQISSEITSTLDLDQVLEIVLRATERVLGFQHSMILLKDLAEDTLRLFASRGYDPTGVGAEVAFGEGVIGVVAERKRMMRVGSLGAGIAYITSIRARLEAAGEVAPAGAAAKLPGLPKAQSQLALPLLVKDRLGR